MPLIYVEASKAISRFYTEYQCGTLIIPSKTKKITIQGCSKINYFSTNQIMQVRTNLKQYSASHYTSMANVKAMP